MTSLADNAIELRIPSKPEYVSIARALVTDLAHRIALSASAVQDVQVAVSEACANVVRHAYPNSPESPEILVRCVTDEDRLIMEVADKGRGFDEAAVSVHCPRHDGGLGLLLIRNLMDDVSLDSSPDEGTVVRMVKVGRLTGARRLSAGLSARRL